MAGGILNGGTLTVTSSTFTGNRGGDGGGIRNVGTLTITNSTFTGNSGGGINNAGGTLTVTNSTFTGNSASQGGGIRNDNSLTVTNSTFTGNSGGDGGGIFNVFTLTVTNSIFTDNGAPGGVGFVGSGGGIDSVGTLTVTSSTFTGNSAGEGGGINAEGTVTVTNSTFSSNSAGKNGGGIFNAAGTRTVTNSTFSGNSAGNKGGGISGGGSVTNSIVANSTSGGNCDGGVTDGGHNIEDGTTCGFTGTGCTSTSGSSFCSTNPQLDPAGLANNGGPTQTIALQAGSPAVNAGNESVCAAAPVNNRDQRGFVRPGTGHTNCSIGAYEADATPPACTGDCDGTGTVAMNDLITLASIVLGTANVSTCPHGVPSGSEVNISLIIQAVNNALNGCGEPR